MFCEICADFRVYDIFKLSFMYVYAVAFIGVLSRVIVKIHYMLTIGGGGRNDRWSDVDSLAGQVVV